MKTFFVSALTALSACAGANNSTVADADRSGQITVQGNEAASVIGALIAAGVPRAPQSSLGTDTYAVSSIGCTAPVIPTPRPYCSLVTTDGQTLSVPEAAALPLYNALLSNGARVATGTLGTNLAVADTISCSEPVVPNPKASCTMFVGIRN